MKSRVRYAEAIYLSLMIRPAHMQVQLNNQQYQPVLVYWS
jgi:hypothetical protein